MALEMRKALQFFLASLDVETQEQSILEVASVFPEYEIGKAYKTKEVFSYGTNAVGDAQLYQVLQDHTSSEEWKPDASTSLYKAIGVTEEGYPEWVQPLGSTDAYMKDDVVSFGNQLWVSTVENNVWKPGEYGWKLKG